MGLHLFFLPNFPGATFIQGVMFIPDSRVGDSVNTLISVIIPVLRCLTPQSTTRMQLESSPPDHFVTFNPMSYSVHFFRNPCLNTRATTAVFPGLHLFFNWHGKLSVIKVFAGFHGHRWQLFRDFHLKKCKENIRWGEIISEVEFAFPCVCLIIRLDAFIEEWMSIPMWILPLCH